ncbi:MFS transporter [Brevibacillus sp. DP1.3A]|uniref:MFS transporter n=1 Tax=Brevibacillus sp. DP1.3A TaxID=2738867 RepID=UPI00156B0493|nr:MFS transporter [Brevibacillus sp. DP1.3A]UED74127.1 MFS transporter [Brevibacillus sp. DP1.3A]
MQTEPQQQSAEKVLRVLVFTLMITVMSATMFNIVLPQIRTEFHLSFSQVSWVTSAFLLIYAVGTVMYGKLADSYKLKHLLTFGLILFAIGSVIGFFAHNYGMVLFGRIVQAAGAAVVPATSSIIPVRYFPPESRGRALGISMTGMAIGSALGPVLSSLLVSLLDWRWLFCMPLFTLFAVPFFRKYLEEEEREAVKMDWIGGGLLAITIALLLLAITNQSFLLALGCILSFLLFLVRIRTTAEPFVRPGLFRSKRYSLGLVIAFLMIGSGYSFAFLSPQLLANVNHLAPGLIGFVMVPGAIVTAFLGKKAGILADKKGNSYLFYTASVLLLCSFVLFSSFAGVSPFLIAVFLIFGNVGLSFMMISMSNAISQSLPKEQIGVGMGLLAMLNFIAGALAATLYGKMIDGGAAVSWNLFNSYSGASVYSNIYSALVLVVLGLACLYYRQFGRSSVRGFN